MNISNSDQAFSLFGALCIGLALGLLYDLIRPFRLRVGAVPEALLDLFYWAIVTMVIFFSVPVLGEGYLRGFLVLLHLLGALLYFQFFSRPLRVVSRLLDQILSQVFSVLFWPLRRLELILTAQLTIFFAMLKKSVKKLFSFLLKWVRMNNMLKRSTPVTSQTVESEEGVPGDQNKKGWSCD